MASGSVTEASVYDCVGHPSKADVKTIINVLLNENFTVASQSESSPDQLISKYSTSAYSFQHCPI